MKQTTISDCFEIRLPRLYNPAGSITAINGFQEIPFAIKRVYYLYDIPGGESRGGHAHKALQQLIVAASGSFAISLSDGNDRRVFHLSQPYNGIYVPPGLWRELDQFSSGAICLVLASTTFSEDDYIRNYQDFIAYKS